RGQGTEGERAQELVAVSWAGVAPCAIAAQPRARCWVGRACFATPQRGLRIECRLRRLMADGVDTRETAAARRLPHVLCNTHGAPERPGPGSPERPRPPARAPRGPPAPPGYRALIARPHSAHALRGRRPRRLLLEAEVDVGVDVGDVH